MTDTPADTTGPGRDTEQASVNDTTWLDLWLDAYTQCESADWDADAIEFPDAMTAALMESYQAHGQDADIVRACIAAAAQQHQMWSPLDLGAISRGFAVRLDSWAELAQNWLDDHYPGLPGHWLTGLDRIGKEVRRDSELYVQLDANPEVFVFTKPGYPQ